MFTDEELKRLKKCSELSSRELSYKQIQALLARLKAAERFINFVNDGSTIHWDSGKGNKGMALWEAWLKSKGGV